MNKDGLNAILNFKKPYREKRLGAARWVMDHPEAMPEVISYAFNPKSDQSMQALWTLEFIGREQLELLYPHLDKLFTYLPVAKGDHILRPLSFLCELLAVAHYKNKDQVLGNAFTSEHKTVMTECAFDWMITQQKVACQVRAMTCLYYLGTEYEWIHPELKTILEQQLHSGSAGYQSRGIKILQKLG